MIMELSSSYIFAIQCFWIIASIIFGSVAVVGIIKAILQYKKEMKEIEEKYNLKIICK